MHAATKRASAVHLFSTQFNSGKCTGADMLHDASAAAAVFCDHRSTQLIRQLRPQSTRGICIEATQPFTMPQQYVD
jgi:hypothetical protein